MIGVIKKFLFKNYFWLLFGILLPVFMYLRLTRGRSLGINWSRRRKEGFQNGAAAGTTTLLYPERPTFKPRAMEPLKEVTSTEAVRAALAPITKENQLREVQAAIAAVAKP